jgi:hypothetical protein
MSISTPLRRPRRLHRSAGTALVALVLLAGLAACSHLSETPAHAASISGEWVLDPASSDDFDALLRQAIETQDKKLRKRMRVPSIGDHDVPPLGMLPPEEPELIHARLTEELRPGDTLKIVWLEGTLQISANGEPARSFVPGRTASRIDVAGAGQITTGWDGDQFRVRTKYGSSELRVQSFSIDAASGRLIVTLSVRSDALNKLDVTSRYHRAG